MPHSRLELARSTLDLAFFRSTGAPLVTGNAVRVLRDATENYPAWKETIGAARTSVCLEMYIIANDLTGRAFLSLLTGRARSGVRVRLLYDWLGCWGAAAAGLFKPLIAAGAEVRASNRPRLAEPAGMLCRDHRKLLIVDNRVAFVSGLCLGDAWLGNPAGGKAPWRDTGVEIRGPAVADALAVFRDTWNESGSAWDGEAPPESEMEVPGPVALRTIATTPAEANLYRLDLLVAASAQETLWLTDAYFIGPHAYRDALRNAALDGVDVRLLVPRSSDLPWVATVSRTLYRSLLESGVRVFEWDGPMIHAKTAVADGRWARVDSSNLNISSLLGNWEIDVAIENIDVAGTLEEQFLADLQQSTEIQLGRKRRVVLSRPRRRLRSPRDSAMRSARGAVGYAAHLGGTVGAAVGGHRPLDATEAGALMGVGTVMLAIAAITWFYPALLTVPVACFLLWAGLSVLFKALWLKRRQSAGEGPSP